MLSQSIGIAIAIPQIDTALGNEVAVSPQPQLWANGSGAFWVNASGANWVTLY